MGEGLELNINDSRLNFGGKVFGLNLLENLITEFNKTKNSFDFNSQIPPSLVISNKIYQRYEQFLETEIGLDFKLIDKKKDRLEKRLDILLNSTFIGDRFSDFSRSTKLFDERNDLKTQNFHFRSSTTKEDWIDKSLFGSLPTFVIPNSNSTLNEGLFKIFTKYYILKKLNPNKLENDNLNVLIMPTIEHPKIKTMHSTIHSSIYSNEKSVARIELTRIEKYYDDEISQISPLQLIEYNQNKDSLKVFYCDSGFLSGNLDIEEKLQSQNPYKIDNKSCAISKRQALILGEFSKFAEKKLGFPIDLECILINDLNSTNLSIFPVQLRPIPNEVKNKNLKKLEEDSILIDEIPFVYGTFREELEILRINRIFNDPKIEKQLKKSANLYDYSSKYDGLVQITVDYSTTLSHGFDFFPSSLNRYSKNLDEVLTSIRNDKKVLGFVNIEDRLTNFLTNYIYSINEFEEDYKISPCKFILESDGRNGRIYISKEELNKFKNFKSNHRKEIFQDCDIPF